MAKREKGGFSPLSLVTNYDEHPHELPQAFNSDPREGLQAFDVGSLILADDKGSSAPEHVELGQDPMIVVSEDDHNGDAQRNNSNNTDGSGGGESAKEKGKRTCGLSPRIFWPLLVVLFLIVVGAAVGGGVGGSIAADNRRKAHAASVSLASAIAASASAASASAVSASAVSASAASANAAAASASKTASSTSSAPSSTSTPGYGNFTVEVFKGQNFTDTHQNYSSVGIFSLPFTANSYIWDGRQSGCCVTFCSKSIWIGYRCQSDTYQPKVNMDKVILSCGGPAAESNSTCQ
ncbi:uncharacterized protein K441DRAFT_697242 [Cenococcum geophilum 1.58]|uniref:uncharacterized protein n=1 Tax=Cenococcum geophilum 1.58 TaxID=794803 RepID=UPI0035901E53|nr:hypothetical protein K441DRAFT_697242 [Cenococcum geophilum 1.58]